MQSIHINTWLNSMKHKYITIKESTIKYKYRNIFIVISIIFFFFPFFKSSLFLRYYFISMSNKFCVFDGCVSGGCKCLAPIMQCDNKGSGTCIMPGLIFSVAPVLIKFPFLSHSMALNCFHYCSCRHNCTLLLLLWIVFILSKML